MCQTKKISLVIHSAFSLYIKSTVVKVKWIFYDIIMITRCPNETGNGNKQCFKEWVLKML